MKTFKIKNINGLNSILIAIFTVLFFGLSLWMIAKPYFGVRYNYKIGDIVQEDIVSPRNITYINVKETEKRINEVKNRVPAVFDYKEGINKDVLNNLNNFLASLEMEDTDAVSMKYGISPQVIRILKKYMKIDNYREKIVSIAEDIMLVGLSDLTRDELNRYKNGGLLLRRIRESEIVQEKVDVNKIIASDEIEIAIEKYIKNNFIKFDLQELKATAIVLRKLLAPNIFYNETESKHLLDEEISKVQPVYNTIKKGAVVIRRGEEIDSSNYPKLKAITQYTNRFNVRAISGIGIILLFIVGLTLYAFKTWSNGEFERNYFIFLSFFLAAVVYSYLITLIKNLPAYMTFGVLVPTAGLVMISEILFKKRFSSLLAISVPIVLLLISGNDPYTLIFSMASGMVSLFAVEKAEKRIDLLKSSVYVVGANVLILVAIGLLKELNARDMLALLLWGAGNGVVSIVLTLGIIPFFEILLNIPTNFRLLELADLNNPIMKKMQIEAPGTYYHSINVANMAENAARYIRANPLLVRVAALYHDIGKIPNAEYFIENNRGVNKHDFLKPSLSNSILKAHIKMGVEMAKELKLPREVIEIIEQHHGTSLMKYFYHQALMEKNNRYDEIDKSEYRYPGPKPQTREAAIVMLADAVEAASRTLVNPSAKRIEQMVKDIIESKFRDGQLNESSLTLRGLMKITVVFTKYLTGLFHTRIEYPDDRKIEEIEEARKQKK